MNIYDIAKEAGVSPATVSRVLNNHKNVKEETRNKIQEVIKGKNYSPNTIARNLSVGTSRNIAFMVPDIENPFFSKILHGISDRAMDNDYNVFMFGTAENTAREHKILDSLKIEMMKGLIIIPVSEADRETAERLKEFEEQGVPVVLIDRDVRNARFDAVFSEDMEGACEAVECLIEEGHKKIGIITGPDTSRPGHERLKGYKRALANNGISLNKDYIICGNFMEDESYEAMKQLLDLEGPPTAVFTSNNMTTLGALRCLKERQMKLGADISVVGFDDIKELAYTDIHLTAVTRPVYEMGCEAMRILERRFRKAEGVEEEKLIIQRNLVKTWLIKRGSEKHKDLSGGSDTYHT